MLDLHIGCSEEKYSELSLHALIIDYLGGWDRDNE